MRRIGALLGLVLLALVVLLTRPSDADANPPIAIETAPADAAPAAVVTPGPVAADPVRATGLDGAFVAAALTTQDAAIESADEGDNRSGVLRGRLTVRQQPWHHPAGVEIRLTRSWLDSVVPDVVEPGLEAPARDELRTTTDRDGRFAFRLIPPSTELFFLIGHASEWEDYQKVPKLPRSGEQLDLGDIFVDQRGEIVGRVVGAGDSGVGGVTVRAVDDPLLDGKSGFDDAFAARLRDVEHFRLPGTTSAGPVPAWVLRRDQMLPFPTATTERDGTFRLRGVRPGNHGIFASLAATTTGDGACYGRTDSVLVVSGRTTDVGAVRLHSPRPLQLRFIDTDRKPWVNAQVAVLHAMTGFGNSSARTDAEGRVKLPSPDGAKGRLLFGMTHEGPWFELAWPTVPDLAWLQNDGMPAIVVRRPREVKVVVRDDASRNIAGASVRTYVAADAFRPTDRLLPRAWQPRQTGDGEFTARIVEGTVFVASAPGYAPALTTLALLPIVPIQMVPLQQATVVVRTRRGQPVADAGVRVQVHGNPELHFPGAQWNALTNDRVLLGRTDERGELTVPIWPTWFSFQASHRDFAPTAGPKLLPRPGDRIELVLLGGGDVRGMLTIEGVAAPAGIRVRARQRPPEGSELAKSVFLEERLAVTGETGAFAFRRLVAGIWELTPELPGAPRGTGANAGAPTQAWKPTRIQLDEGQELHTTIEIQGDWFAPVQVHGSITQNGATLAGALVRVRELDPPALKGRNAERRMLRELLRRHGEALALPEEKPPWQRCTTDAFGEFRFRDLTPGEDHELRVDVLVGGRLQFVERRIVRSGTIDRPLRLDIPLPTGNVRLACQYRGRALVDRMLRLRRVEGTDVETARYEVLLDGTGELWLDALPAGTWTVEPVHGGRCEPATFEVAAGKPAVVSLTVLDG